MHMRGSVRSFFVGLTLSMTVLTTAAGLYAVAEDSVSSRETEDGNLWIGALGGGIVLPTALIESITDTAIRVKETAELAAPPILVIAKEYLFEGISRLTELP